MCKLVRCHSAISIIGFCTILCISYELLSSIGLLTLLTKRPCDNNGASIAIEKAWAKPSDMNELDMLFSVLALLDASIGMIFLWWFVTSYDLLLANLDHRLTSSISPKQCPCNVVFAQNLAILEQSSMPHFSYIKHP